jgi:hypothetical protein
MIVFETCFNRSSNSEPILIDRKQLIFTRQRPLADEYASGGFEAPLQRASLSQNDQWHLQKPFKPCAEFCNLSMGHNNRSGLKTSD